LANLNFQPNRLSSVCTCSWALV